jgi:hypothetical protein
MGNYHRSTAQRKLTKLVNRLDRVTEGDRLFFERHRHRSHRLRRAGQVEIEEESILRGSRVELPTGAAWFTIVKQLSPGMRARVPVVLPEETNTDISETEAEAVAELFLTPFLRDANQ